MKHQRIVSHQSGIPASGLTDEEIEARVFRNLEARRKRETEERAEEIVIFQYPDNRTILQRLAAWWYLRARPVRPTAGGEAEKVAPEPDWQGHWATIKYL